MLLTRLAFILLAALCCAVAQAAPSVTGTSGTWITGGSVTVSGSSFGTGATSLLMDDFQSASGVIIDQSTQRTPPIRTGIFASTTLQYGCAGSACPSHSYFTATSNPLPGQTKFARTSFDNSQSWNQSISLDLTTTTLYQSFYWRRTPIDGHIGRQFKAYVGYFGGTDRLYFSAGLGTAEGGEPEYFRQHVSGATENPLSTNSSACTNSWCRFEQNVVYSTTSTGQWQSAIHTSTGVEDGVISNAQTASVIPENHDFIGAYFDLNEFGSGTSHVDSAKFVLANSPARVELCAGSTWSTRGLCDYQRATSWATGSASVVPDTGQFANGSTAYVYVCDANNSCNASGHAVTINSGGGSAPVISAVSCGAASVQSPGAASCSVTASNSPTSYSWSGQGQNCTFSDATATPSLICQYGGLRTPCVVATNASGSSNGGTPTCASSVVWRLRKGANVRAQ